MDNTRYSPKRDAILQCLRSTTCHPSAEWVYAQLKPRIPNLSLATVYRNLARFRAEGAVQVIGADPEGSIYSDPNDVHQYQIEGVGEDFYPKAFDRSLPDEIVQVTDAEAFEMTRRLANEEGLLVGGSSGMAVFSALKYAREHDLDENQLVVVLMPDSGRSYMEKIFNDDWMRANGFADVVERTTKPSLAEQYL